MHTCKYTYMYVCIHTHICLLYGLSSMEKQILVVLEAEWSFFLLPIPPLPPLFPSFVVAPQRSFIT